MNSRRTDAEIATEIHTLNNLLTHPTILLIENERDDLDTTDSIRAQIAVISQSMSYDAMLAEYEDEGQYIAGAAYDAYRWMHEDDVPPSAAWAESAEVWESTTVAAVVVRALGGKPASSLQA